MLDQHRDVLEVDWTFFGELCRALALRISGEYDPELVLGITKAGVIPGAVVASILQRDFASMGVTRVGASTRPTLVIEPPPSVTGRRVLIVDETCDTGDTLKLATSAVLRLNPAEVRTAVSFRTRSYEPDYHAVSTESFIILPWDREVIVGGELVLRPSYADKLGSDTVGFSQSESTDS
jgi:hypoxanthine phosphoribosyltransferase